MGLIGASQGEEVRFFIFLILSNCKIFLSFLIVLFIVPYFLSIFIFSKIRQPPAADVFLLSIELLLFIFGYNR